MTDEGLDSILEKISLAFGNEALNIVIPEDVAIHLSMYHISNINSDDLDRELIRQSKFYTLFQSLLAYMSDKYSRTDALVERLEAQLSLQYEQQLKTQEDRVSDKKIEKLVDADEIYLTAIDQRLDYKNMVVSFQGMLKSLEVKRDMLLQLVIKRRQEIGQGQPPVI